jgi:hypothetical protein
MYRISVGVKTRGLKQRKSDTAEPWFGTMRLKKKRSMEVALHCNRGSQSEAAAVPGVLCGAA